MLKILKTVECQAYVKFDIWALFFFLNFLYFLENWVPPNVYARPYF